MKNIYSISLNIQTLSPLKKPYPIIMYKFPGNKHYIKVAQCLGLWWIYGNNFSHFKIELTLYMQ